MNEELLRGGLERGWWLDGYSWNLKSDKKEKREGGGGKSLRSCIQCFFASRPHADDMTPPEVLDGGGTWHFMNRQARSSTYKSTAKVGSSPKDGPTTGRDSALLHGSGGARTALPVRRGAVALSEEPSSRVWRPAGLLELKESSHGILAPLPPSLALGSVAVIDVLPKRRQRVAPNATCSYQ